MGSDHFPIIKKDEREVSNKHHQKWNLEKAN